MFGFGGMVRLVEVIGHDLGLSGFEDCCRAELGVGPEVFGVDPDGDEDGSLTPERERSASRSQWWVSIWMAMSRSLDKEVGFPWSEIRSLSRSGRPW